MADKSKIYSEWDDIIDESTLLRFAKQADIEATERLIQHYARMVRAIARTYYLSGAESEDAIQEGMLGLLYAIRSYDPSQKIEFSAYARVCIERRLISAWRKANSHKHDPLNYAISLDKSPFEEDIETDRISDANPESMLIHQEEQRESHERLRELLAAAQPDGDLGGCRRGPVFAGRHLGAFPVLSRSVDGVSHPGHRRGDQNRYRHPRADGAGH